MPADPTTPTPQPDGPLAYAFEIATSRWPDGRYDGWEKRLSDRKPEVPEGSIRNLRPLYAHPQPGGELREAAEAVSMSAVRFEERPSESCVASAVVDRLRAALRTLPSTPSRDITALLDGLDLWFRTVPEPGTEAATTMLGNVRAIRAALSAPPREEEASGRETFDFSRTHIVERRGPVEHELKTWSVPFAAVESGAKPFEFRRNDRDFREGDALWLRETEIGGGSYTGRELKRTITYALLGGQFGVPVGYAVLGLAPIPPKDAGALEARIAVLESAIRWACGYDEGGESFPGPEVRAGGHVAPFGWRRELRRRAGLSAPEPAP
jgi:hypothetical protein